MGKKWAFKVVLSIISGILAVSPAYSSNQNEVGELSAAFLQNNPSVRMAALGGDQVAAQNGVDVIYSNPANLSSLLIPQLFLSHNSSFLDSSDQSLSFGLPFRNQALAFSLQHVDGGDVDRVDIDNSGEPVFGLGSTSFSTLALKGTLSKPLGERVLGGISFKGWKEDREFSNTSGWATDLGLQFKSVLRSMDVGLAVKNLGPKVDGFKIPLSYALGAAYHLPFGASGFESTLMAQVDRDSADDTGVRAGVEVHKEMFWIRGGYQNSTSDLDDPISAFSFGGGVQLKGWKVDYAWVPKGDLGDQHRFAVSMGFGMTPREREKMAKELDKAMRKQVSVEAKKEYQKAEKSFQTGKWASAAEHYSQTLSWVPNYKDAQKKLKLANSKLNFAKANKHYEKGQTLVRKSMWLDAVVEFRHSLSLIPTHKEAKRSLAKAERKIKMTKKPKQDSLAALYNKGVKFYIDGQYKEAIREWTKITNKNPNYRDTGKFIVKAEKMIVVEEYKAYQEKQEEQKENVSELSQQAYTHYMLGDLDHAIRLWERVLILNPNDQSARLALKNARQKESLVAKSSHKKATKKVYVLRVNAIKAYKAGELNKAVGYWRQLLKLDPQNIWVKNNLDRVERELVAKQSDERRAN